MERNAAFVLLKGCIFQIFSTSFGLGLYIQNTFWVVVGLGRSFQGKGLGKGSQTRGPRGSFVRLAMLFAKFQVINISLPRVLKKDAAK